MRRGSPVGPALGVVGLAGAALLASAAQVSADAPGARWWAWLGSWVWAPGIATAVAVLPLLLPDGRLPSARWRPLRRSAVATVVALSVVLALRPGPLEGHTDVVNPVGVRALGGVLSAVESALYAAVAALAVLGLAQMVAQWRGGDRQVRQQLEWPLVAVVLLLSYYVVAPFVPGAETLAPFAVVVLPAGILAGVLARGLYDVDRLLVRTVVAAVLTGLVLGASVLVSALAGAAVSEERRVTWAALVTGVVAVAFTPVRAQLQRLVNRVTHGHTDDPLAALERVGERLALALPPEDVLRAVVDVVSSELRAPYVALRLSREGALMRSASAGEPTGAELELPVQHGGEVVGELVIGPRAGGLDRRGRRVLEQLVRSAAPALHAAVLAEQLKRSREHLVLAREDERRRLRRDLHDGLGALLSGVSMTVAALEQSERDQARRADCHHGGVLSDVVAVVAAPVAAFELGVLSEVFGLDRTADGLPAFDFAVASLTPGLLATTAGYAIQVEHDLHRLASADLIAVPSWTEQDQPAPAELVAALHDAVDRGARILGVCSGAFLLAAAGLLDGKRAAPHWRYAPTLAGRYPRVQVDADVLYVDAGSVLTSAGTAAAIDLCLHVVRAEYSAAVANAFARRMVVAPHRSGGQAQFAEAPVSPVVEDDLAPVREWACAHLDQPITVAQLATRALMSPRTFARRFTATTSPNAA